jgi:arsenate reductase (thioredoxin)
MAEGFARKYGSDIMEPASAGLAPASIVQPLTKKVMSARKIDIEGQHPKNLDTLDIRTFDLIVNMSGATLPSGRLPMQVREWKVEDPIGQTEEVYCAVRDQIENEVMRLILELRKEARNKSGNATPRPRFTRARAKN